MDFTGFPMCSNGDVLIVLAPDRKLKLHAEMLKRQSKFFRDKVVQENAATLSDGAKRSGETTRWRFDLVEPTGPGDGVTGRLRMVEIDSWARVQEGQLTASPDYSGRTEPNPIYSHYSKIFGAFYSQQFNIEDSEITALVHEVVGLIEVSEYLGCVHAVSRTIDAALLGQGQILFRSIASNPTAWVDLAVRVQSASVFQEAIVHLTGQWGRLGAEEKAKLGRRVIELCEAKAKELDDRKKLVECRVLKFYPPHMGREIGAPSGNIGRMSYGNDIMDWIALCVFRHWFSSALALDRHRRAPDGGYWLYSKLAEGKNAYLSKQELKSFHERFPMTTRGEHVLERHVNQVKEDVRPLVAELLKNESQLDCERFAVDYLTCIKVEKEKASKMWEERKGEILSWASQTVNATVAKDKEKKQSMKRMRNTKATTTEVAVGGGDDSESEDECWVVKKVKGSRGFEEGSSDAVDSGEDSGDD